MKYCPNCGAPVEAGHKYCAGCGTKLELPAQAPDAMPAEPVYTEDPALLNDPVLNTSPDFTPKPKKEKVPELTLEPDLWGLGAAAAAAQAAPPAAAAQAAEAAKPAPAVDLKKPAEEQRKPAAEPKKPAEEQQAPNYADYMGGVQHEEPLHYTQQDYANVPNDYTMSSAQSTEKAPDETLMLVWSIILTALCSIPGLVGLIMTVRARKLPLALKIQKLKTAKIWLIVGTVLYAIGFFGALS